MLINPAYFTEFCCEEFVANISSNSMLVSVVLVEAANTDACNFSDTIGRQALEAFFFQYL